MAFNFFSKDMGIDLGTANTLIYIKEQGIVLDEPTVIAVDTRNNNVVATGTEAKKMIGKAPAVLSVVRPLKDGVISDFDMTAEMLKYFIRKAVDDKKVSFRVVVGVPSGVTEVEKRAVEEVVRQMGAKEVYILDEPMAAAIGAGLDVDSATASMIADIGGGTTDVAIVALGGIVTSTSLRYAGDKFNEAVIQFMRKKYGLLIGERTAEILKKEVGCALVDRDSSGEPVVTTTEASGRDIVSGFPKTLEISNLDMEEALHESVEMIVDAVKSTIEKAPPEIAADIANYGMVLSGGGGMIRNLDKLIGQRTGMSVKIAENAFEAVALGTGQSLDDVEKLKLYAKAKYR